MNTCFRRLAALAGAVAFAAASAALAQTYPTKPVTIIVPWPPGGPSDIAARPLAKGLSEELKQSFVTDNRGGAGGNIGTAIVTKAAPDGYTLVMGANSMTINPAIPGMRAPDPVRELAPVTKLVTIPDVIAVAPSVEARTLQELLALARRSPRKLAYANRGIGTTSHMAAELLAQRAGVEFLHIPYNGAGSVFKDVITGEIPIVISSTGTTAPFVRSGQLRALAVTASRRSAALPDVPTVAESGFPGFEVNSWYGVLAPAGTPPEIVGRLHDELVRILALPDVAELLVRQGMAPVGNTPEQFAAEISADVERWARLVREGRIRAE